MTASHALSQLSYGPTRGVGRKYSNSQGRVKLFRRLTFAPLLANIPACQALYQGFSSGAGVVELVDALDSKSSVPLERVGSSPTSGTTLFFLR